MCIGSVQYALSPRLKWLNSCSTTNAPQLGSWLNPFCFVLACMNSQETFASENIWLKTVTKKRSNIFRLNDTCIKIGLKYDPFCFQRIKAGKLIALYLQPVGVIIKMSVVARFSTINTQSSGQTVTYSTA